MYMDWLETAGQMSVIAGAIGGAFIYVITNVVLNPLKTTIKRLEDAADRFTEQLKKADERWHNHEVELVRINQKVDALHERLDRLEGGGKRQRGGEKNGHYQHR